MQNRLTTVLIRVELKIQDSSIPEFMALNYSQQTPNTITRVAHATHKPGALS